MAAILASHSCYCCRELTDHGKQRENFSFSGSISGQNSWKYGRHLNYLPKTKEIHWFQVIMQQTESQVKLGKNGRPIKMVPASEVMKRKPPMINNTEMLNRSKRSVNGASVKRKEPPVSSEVANGTKTVINAVSKVNGSLVKRDPALVTVKTSKFDKLPPVEDLKVLPSDEGFGWASENYNSVQRTIDVWLFVLSLRVRVLLDNAKWTYVGGFTEDKQKTRRRITASWLRECVLQLGPTFIKLGQLSSTRSDLFPREFVDELAKLQDRVPAFSLKKAKDFIKKELGAPVDQLFKEFEERPIAAASLGASSHHA